MQAIKHIVFLVMAAVMFTAAGGFLACTQSGAAGTGTIIFTQLPAGTPNTRAAWQFPEQSRLVALQPAMPGTSLQVLTPDFVAARAPQLSFDGTRLIFAGKKQKNDSWQIWEMDLGTRRATQVTRRLEGCTDPAYLPDGRIVFSALPPDRATAASAEAGFALYTCARDGSGLERITYHPASDLAAGMLADGRLLFASLDNTAGRSKMLVTRYDGSRLAPFYVPGNPGWQTGRAAETPDRTLVFVEASQPDQPGGALVVLDERRPYHTRRTPHAALPGTFHSVCATAGGRLLAAYRETSQTMFGIYEKTTAPGDELRPIWRDTTYHAIEPVVVEKRRRPKGFVSLVDNQKKTALLYCLDANSSDLPARTGRAASATQVRVNTPAAVLGEVALEADGSFLVELPADTPLRFTALDARGQVVRGPSAWIWLRPNEKVGCIGCHEDRERAPENRVPLAVTHAPVTLPAADYSLAAQPAVQSGEAKQ